MTDSLSVSIVTYAPPLTPSFESVFRHLEEAIVDAQHHHLLERVSITIIDNGNNDSVLENVLGKTDGMQVSLIRNQKNNGYTAHNQAIMQSDTDYHLILNPDVLLNVSSLRVGLEYLKRHQDTVMLCPYSEGQQGEPSYLCKRYPTLLDLALRGFASEAVKQKFDKRLMHYEYRDLPVDQPIRSVELISGCCMLARTPALQQAGGFDQKFFIYFEDFDLSLRIGKLGRLDYLPDMKIIHYGGQAAKKGLRHILYFVQSAARFFSKHGLRVY